MNQKIALTALSLVLIATMDTPGFAGRRGTAKFKSQKEEKSKKFVTPIKQFLPIEEKINNEPSEEKEGGLNPESFKDFKEIAKEIEKELSEKKPQLLGITPVGFVPEGEDSRGVVGSIFGTFYNIGVYIGAGVKGYTPFTSDEAKGFPTNLTPANLLGFCFDKEDKPTDTIVRAYEFSIPKTDEYSGYEGILKFANFQFVPKKSDVLVETIDEKKLTPRAFLTALLNTEDEKVPLIVQRYSKSLTDILSSDLYTYATMEAKISKGTIHVVVYRQRVVKE